MVFGSLELARRIEACEADTLLELTRAASQRAPEREIWAESVGGGVASYLGKASPFNRVGGLGLAGPIDMSQLEGLRARLRQRAASLCIDLCTICDSARLRQLGRSGLVVQRFDHVYAAVLSAGEAPRPAVGRRTGVAMEIMRTECAGELPEDWFDVGARGFVELELSDEHRADTRAAAEDLSRHLRDTIGLPGLLRWSAYIEGRLAGTASLRTTGQGIALFVGASTLPEYRGRGVQTRLLAERLAWARDAGCDLAAVTTGPGSQSAKNVHAAGFELVYARARFGEAEG